MQFTYPSITWSNTIGYERPLPITVPAKTLSNSAIMAYIGLKDPNSEYYNWFLVPGLVKAGPTDFGEYNAWLYAHQSATNQGAGFVIRRESLGTSGALTANVRIVIIPANDLRNGRIATVDFSDYYAVKAYYNLKE